MMSLLLSRTMLEVDSCPPSISLFPELGGTGSIEAADASVCCIRAVNDVEELSVPHFVTIT